MKATKRICIYPKDIMRITGRGERYCHNLVKLMKEDLLKGKHQFITIDEFCQFTGIKAEQVTPFIED